MIYIFIFMVTLRIIKWIVMYRCLRTMEIFDRFVVRSNFTILNVLQK